MPDYRTGRQNDFRNQYGHFNIQIYKHATLA